MEIEIRQEIKRKLRPAPSVHLHWTHLPPYTTIEAFMEQEDESTYYTEPPLPHICAEEDIPL